MKKIMLLYYFMSKLIIRQKDLLMIKYYCSIHMLDETLNPKRIRDHAPNRRSISLTDEDIQRLSYMEKTFASMYPLEVPFSFSKTVSKAIELAFLQVITPMEKPIQQSLTGLPADLEALQVRLEQRQQGPGQQSRSNQGKPKKFQKTKRGF